jgi:uncharacterized Fe-S cluster protein YjdI
MDSSPTKEYDNGEVVITWQPEKCTHSGNCVRGLSAVFNPKKRPWIEISNASTEEIVAQVNRYPSAALGYYFKDQAK